MKHIFKKGTNEQLPTLLLLHGTGGTENDLLPLAELISPQSSVLSVRGMCWRTECLGSSAD